MFVAFDCLPPASLDRCFTMTATRMTSNSTAPDVRLEAQSILSGLCDRNNGRVIARSLDATDTDEPALQADFEAALDAPILNACSRKSKFWNLFKVILRTICDLTKCLKTTISCRSLAGWTPASSPSNKGKSCNVSHTGQCPSGKCL